MADPTIGLMVLDELNIVLRYDYCRSVTWWRSSRRGEAIFMSSSPGATPSRH